jgi:hypothetical protein
MRASFALCGVVVGSLAVTAARGDLIYTSQNRFVEVETSANAQVLTDAAEDFGPFVTTLTSSVIFQTPTGPAENEGTSSIDCQLDPNAIIATGSLTGEGGLNVNGNLEVGEAEAFVFVTFTITELTPWQILASQRPSDNPEDEWEIELENVGTGTNIFRIDETAPPQSVNVSGMLQPGTYSIQFEVEMSVASAEETETFDFLFAIPSPGGVSAFAVASLVACRRRRR